MSCSSSSALMSDGIICEALYLCKAAGRIPYDATSIFEYGVVSKNTWNQSSAPTTRALAKRLLLALKIQHKISRFQQLPDSLSTGAEHC